MIFSYGLHAVPRVALPATDRHPLSIVERFSQIDNCIRVVLADVMPRLQEAFSQVSHPPPPEHALAQNGLLDGETIVREYLDVGEPSLALEHLIYMVEEPPLTISNLAYHCIEEAGRLMSMDNRLWEKLNREQASSDG